MRTTVLAGTMLLTMACGGEDDDEGASGTESESESESESEAESESESEGESESESEGAELGVAAVLVASSDALSGGIAFVDLETLAVSATMRPASGDAVARACGGDLWVLNRTQGSIQVHDPADDFALVTEFSVGTSANPYDVCCTDERAYVVRFDDPAVLVLDLDGFAEAGAIDLSSYDEDGDPDASACLIAGGELFVTLTRLDPEFTPRTPGRVVVIDLATDQVSGAFDVGANPYTRLTPEGLLGATGAWGVLDGGVERLDLAAHLSTGVVVSEQALVGDVNRVASCPDGSIWVIASDAAFNTLICRVDPSGAILPMVDPAGFVHSWIDVDSRGRVWVADRSEGASGLRLWDCDGTPLSDEPIALPLPPAFDGVITFL